MNKIVLTSIVVLALATTSMAAVNSTACAACHGLNFEKHALGKSKIVANLSHSEISTALKGYKAGTFGGSMKTVMNGQVARYSNDELDAFAQTIGK